MTMSSATWVGSSSMVPPRAASGRAGGAGLLEVGDEGAQLIVECADLVGDPLQARVGAGQDR